MKEYNNSNDFFIFVIFLLLLRLLLSLLFLLLLFICSFNRSFIRSAQCVFTRVLRVLNS